MTSAAAGVKLLATTALQASWGTDEPLVFLGEWCRLYDRRDSWERRPHQVVPNHWDDRAKLRRDHDALRTLHEALLEDLARSLNGLHGISRTTRYWRMILDPWLVSYVSVVWDRWECLRQAFEEHGAMRTIALGSPAEDRPFADYNDYIERVLGDAWNHRLILGILESRYPELCAIEPSRGPLSETASFGTRPRRPKEMLLGILDAALGLLPIRDRAVFYMSYFPHLSLARLDLRLGQAPRWFVNEFRARPLLKAGPAAVRENLSVGLAPANPFEAFLFRRIVQDLPRVSVEDFAALRARAESIAMKPEVVLTANAHWGNDLFKLWSAERVHAGARFVAMTHGEGIPMPLGCMSFEEEISDLKTTWSIPHHPKHVRLPPNSLAALQVVSSKAFLAVVGNEMPRYQYRAQSTPHAGQTLAGFEMVCAFHGCLDRRVQEAFRVKPYPDRGWNTRRRFADRLGPGRVSGATSFADLLGTARIVVCTYPQTTFSDAMATGLPVILLYPSKLWETIPEMDSLMARLRAAKIVFDDPEGAAAHVNAVWDAPERWWNGAEAAGARDEFTRLISDASGDWLARWTEFVGDCLAGRLPRRSA